VEQWYRAHAPSLRAFLTSLTRDPHRAEDLMQETFIRATRAIGGYRGGSPRAWLFAIARRCFLDDVRRRRPDPEEEVPESGAEDPDVVEVVTVRAALDRLPESQRAVLVLRDQLGLSYAEVATAMGRTFGATKVLIHRARAGFRLAYEKEGGRG
jgi:RNA polymerase sigma factor (sigma-70 family)